MYPHSSSSIHHQYSVHKRYHASFRPHTRSVLRALERQAIHPHLPSPLMARIQVLGYSRSTPKIQRCKIPSRSRRLDPADIRAIHDLQHRRITPLPLRPLLRIQNGSRHRQYLKLPIIQHPILLRRRSLRCARRQKT